jgi:hypothetical protein
MAEPIKFELLQTEVNGKDAYFFSFDAKRGQEKWSEIGKDLYELLVGGYRGDENAFHTYGRNNVSLMGYSDEIADVADNSRYFETVEEDGNESLRLLKRIKDAFESITLVQQRRLAMHTMLGLGYEQISNLENCSKQSVAGSISAARKNLFMFWLADFYVFRTHRHQ